MQGGEGKARALKRVGVTTGALADSVDMVLGDLTPVLCVVDTEDAILFVRKVFIS